MTRATFNSNQCTVECDCATPLVVVVDDDPDRAVLAAQWRALEPRADGSVFNSWMWVSAVLAHGLDQPLVVQVLADQRVVAIGVFQRARRWGARTLSLTAVDDPAIDAAYIEYNAPLVDRDYPQAALIWWQAIGRLGATMVYLPGIAAEHTGPLHSMGALLVERRQPAPRRDLAMVRASGGDVLALMSANSRAQLRRALRSYQRSGPITLSRATTREAAHRAFAHMAELHQASWRRRGQAGAMSGQFCRFHHDILDYGVAAGQVDLLTVKAGDRLIGYLYNLRYGQTVCAYQSGFAYDEAFAHEKPGLVCHAAAISDYAKQGLGIYDFLAGEARYKTSFSDHAPMLVWARLVFGYTPLAISLKGRARLQAAMRGLVEKFYS